MADPEPLPARVDLRDVANLAGILTLARLPLAFAFAALVHDPVWSAALYGLAIGSDLLDGPVARATNTTSQVGSLLDGFLDKAFHVNAAWALAVADRVPAWWLLCWFSREIVQLAMVPWLWGRFLRGGVQPHHAHPGGKALSVALGATFLLVLAGPWWPTGPVVAGLATPVLGLAGAAIGAHYIWRSRSLLVDRDDPLRPGS